MAANRFLTMVALVAAMGRSYSGGEWVLYRRS
jgi:hypothetical protein